MDWIVYMFIGEKKWNKVEGPESLQERIAQNLPRGCYSRSKGLAKLKVVASRSRHCGSAKDALIIHFTNLFSKLLTNLNDT